MLKIKDNVDLKELEKFGFKRAIDISMMNFDGFRKLDYYTYEPKNSLSLLQIDEQTNLIYLTDNNNDDGILKLYDLIKADLVEKVSDGNE